MEVNLCGDCKHCKPYGYKYGVYCDILNMQIGMDLYACDSYDEEETV